MKKALIFSTAYIPFIGGAEIAIKEITSRVSDFDFDMITARMDRKLPRFEKIGNINVYRIGFGIAKLDKYLLASRGHKLAQKLHKQNSYSFVWSVMASYGGFAALSFKKKNPKVPFLLTLQEGDETDYIRKRVGSFGARFRQIFENADYIQCISRFLAEWAKSNGAKAPIEIVPNGVDIENFSREISGEELSDLKKRLDKKEGDIFLITVSRLVTKNAMSDIIRALQYTFNNIKLLVLGTGLEEEKLKLLAKELGVEDRVLFLGHINHNELPKYLKVSDIFVRPSLSEGLGNSFLEAMAAGVPVIGTPVGGILDFLTDFETGLFCTVKDPASIADKVKLLLDNKDLREKIVSNAKKLVEKNYDWNLVAQKMSKIFEKLENE